MNNIYDYNKASDFLRDAWDEKQRLSPQLSLRSWAKHLGLESHAPLHLMISGKRNIPKKYVPTFANYFDLTAKESLYFETLVDLERSKDIEKKEFYLQRLRKLSPRHDVKMVEIEQFRFLRDPLHTLLLEMVDLHSFSGDPKKISHALHPKVSATQIAAALDRLVSIGLLIENKRGHFVKTNKHITTIPDLKDRAVQEYHQNVSRLAADLIVEQDVLEREFNSYSLNIKASSLPKAKKLLREFARKFITEVEASPNEGEQTYQLNLQLFALTKRKIP